MATAGIMQCSDCRMTFRSTALLHKHKSRFCPGESQDPPSHRYPQPQQDRRYSSPVQNKISELEHLKQEKNLQRQKEDLTEQQMLNIIRLSSPEAVPKPLETPQNLWESRSQELRFLNKQITDGYRGGDNDYDTHSVSSSASVSIHLPPATPDEEYTAPPPNSEREYRQRQLRQQVEHHGRKAAEYKSITFDLEQQKKDIDQRLLQLSRNGVDKSSQDNSRWLQQLHQQEATNQRALSQLKKQLQQVPKDRPSTSGDNVLGEINAMRRAYLIQGGNNAALLSQMAELELAASSAGEGQDRRGGQKKAQGHKDRYDGLNDQVLAFDSENKRLQDELLSIQQRNNQHLQDHLSRPDQERQAEELLQKQEEYRRRLGDMEQEIEMLHKQSKLEKLRHAMGLERTRTPPPQHAPPPQQPPNKYGPPGNYESADVPYLMQPTQQQMPDPDINAMAPYDPSAGFMVFYDFVSGLDPGTQSVRLVVGLYNRNMQYGEPSVLPTSYTQPAAGTYGGQTALVAAKQPVPRCPPTPELGMVIELQTGGATQHYAAAHLSTRAWCKLDLFDLGSRLISGRWKVPFRVPPIKPNSTTAALNTIPQFGSTELYLRLVNFRDTDIQSTVIPNAQNHALYHYPPQLTSSPPGRSMSSASLPSPVYPPSTIRSSYQASALPLHIPQEYVPPPPSSTPPSTAGSARVPRHRKHHLDTDSSTIGFQMDRVKNSDPGIAKMRLTAYYKDNAQVVQSDTSPVTCSTTAVSSNYKHRYHVFGQQEAVFEGVQSRYDMLVVVRFYLRRRLEHGLDDELTDSIQDPRHFDDETLTAWGTVPLMVLRSGHEEDRHGDLSNYRVNQGTHTLQLFEPPVPQIDLIPLDEHHTRKAWVRHGKATARIYIYSGKPRPGSLTSSDLSEDEDECPPLAWLPKDHVGFETEPYTSTDGFDIYMDGCLNLPDSVTITRVAARILTRKYEKSGKDINSSVSLASDIYNPVYDHRVEIREPNLPPSSTLLIKVYTIDKFYKQLMVAGYAALNLFVETGTDRQPTTDMAGIQISLNVGAHQLRLYQFGPNGIDALTESCLRDIGIRSVPCATILVRIYKAPIGPHGRPMEADKVPRVDWVRMGLFHPRPEYSENVYYSAKCKPSTGECKLFQTLMKRHRISCREALPMIAEHSDIKNLKTDKAIDGYIRTQLTKLMDVIPMDIDVTFISQYSPRHGIKFSLDGAMNLPWGNFTHSHICFNPPGAFYKGPPNAAFDKPMFTRNLDLNSTNSSPSWNDGFFHFRNRAYHRFLAIIVHLQEVVVSVATDSYKYGLLDQAWTVVPVFCEGYAYTQAFQLPLLHGAPTLQHLQQLAKEPPTEWLLRMQKTYSKLFMDGTSVFVRLADGRRDDELPGDLSGGVMVTINTDLLPQQKLSDYSVRSEGRPLRDLVPQGKTQQEFTDTLAVKFKSLVYKSYEEGNVFQRDS